MPAFSFILTFVLAPVMLLAALAVESLTSQRWRWSIRSTILLAGLALLAGLGLVAAKLLVVGLLWRREPALVMESPSGSGRTTPASG